MESIGIIELLDNFKDEKACLQHYERIRWQGKPVCPHCQAEHPYVTNRGYKCRSKTCRKKFNAKTGTIYENTKLPMRKWFLAMYLFMINRKGVSAHLLAKELKVTIKTAWFVLHRLRETLKDDAVKTTGVVNVVEMDETHIGGKEKNKHNRKKRSVINPDFTREGKPYKPKKMVFGIIQRGGEVVLKYMPEWDQHLIVDFIRQHVPPENSIVYTDEHNFYRHLDGTYFHFTVNHGQKEYVVGNIHTNTIENFWSVLKRGIAGSYQSISERHIHRYLYEYAARHNLKNFSIQEQMDIVFAKSNCRLKYNDLIAA